MGVGKTVNLTVLSTQRTMLTCKYPLPSRQDAREQQLRLWDAEKGEQQPLTTHLCPRNFLSSCPVSTLHIRTLQSPLFPKPVFPLQEATSEPSAEKLTPLTCELYFGFKLVTTLTTLCNGRLRLCRFLEVSGNTFVILVYVSPPVSGERA